MEERKTISIKFIGKDCSLGYKNGKIYEIDYYKYDNLPYDRFISVSPHHTLKSFIFPWLIFTTPDQVFYDSDDAFFANWREPNDGQ